MAYQIRYSGAAMVKEVKKPRKMNIKIGIIVCLALMFIGLLQIETVQNFFIPGDPQSTKAAFSSFTNELRAGEPFSDAAAVFCRQILQGEDIEK